MTCEGLFPDEGLTCVAAGVGQSESAVEDIHITTVASDTVKIGASCYSEYVYYFRVISDSADCL